MRGKLVKILVVDDDFGVRNFLRVFLERYGFAVLLAEGGLMATELYREHQQSLALVLLDVQMPGMDGPQTLAELQKINPAVVCCFMTGSRGD